MMRAEELLERLTACGIPAEREQAARLARYHGMLLDWNSRMDLTALTDEAEMTDRHYVDSLIVLTRPELLSGVSSLIDVGTGAGFPGLLLALWQPEIRVTLMDALRKRLDFLQAAAEALGLDNVRLLHARAEDAGRQAEHREHYDAAVARAVAPMPVLAEYLLPFVRVGGRALCWKGPAALEEMTQARRAAQLLGGQIGEPLPMPIPGRDWQHLLIPIDKRSPTPKSYPRKAGTPSKAPLGGKDRPS